VLRGDCAGVETTGCLSPRCSGSDVPEQTVPGGSARPGPASSEAVALRGSNREGTRLTGLIFPPAPHPQLNINAAPGSPRVSPDPLVHCRILRRSGRRTEPTTAAAVELLVPDMRAALAILSKPGPCHITSTASGQGIRLCWSSGASKSAGNFEQGLIRWRPGPAARPRSLAAGIHPA
jgi:hypothetical protein